MVSFSHSIIDRFTCSCGDVCLLLTGPSLLACSSLLGSCFKGREAHKDDNSSLLDEQNNEKSHVGNDASAQRREHGVWIVFPPGARKRIEIDRNEWREGRERDKPTRREEKDNGLCLRRSTPKASSELHRVGELRHPVEQVHSRIHWISLGNDELTKYSMLSVRKSVRLKTRTSV